MKFTRNTINRILNFVLYINFCLMVGTGYILAFRLPPGSRGGKDMSMMGFDRHDWGDFHWYLSIVFLILIVVHLAVHWKWLVQVAGNKQKRPMLIGVAFGFLLILFLAIYPVSLST